MPSQETFVDENGIEWIVRGKGPWARRKGEDSSECRYCGAPYVFRWNGWLCTGTHRPGCLGNEEKAGDV